MPLYIVREDITKIQCDAIVNPTNNQVSPTGGIDALIQKAAGEQLKKAREQLGGIKTGQVKTTPAFNLPCKHIIHTVGPIWQGGVANESALLKSCYINSLKTAKEVGCESLAIPLISSGAYNYPKDQVLKIAVDSINEFLQENELEVYLVVYDKTSYEFSQRLYGEVHSFILENYEDENETRRELRIDWETLFFRMNWEVEEKRVSTIEEMLMQIDEPFSVALLKLIDLKRMTDLECYKRANVSKQTWYKILNEKNYKPSKNTVIAFAISLKLTFDETQKLLSTVGFTLSKSSKFDIIIEYFIKNNIYDIMQINQTLFEFDQPCLGY